MILSMLISLISSSHAATMWQSPYRVLYTDLLIKKDHFAALDMEMRKEDILRKMLVRMFGSTVQARQKFKIKG
jgi:hypothetical protein